MSFCDLKRNVMDSKRSSSFSFDSWESRPAFGPIFGVRPTIAILKFGFFSIAWLAENHSAGRPAPEIARQKLWRERSNAPGHPLPPYPLLTVCRDDDSGGGENDLSAKKIINQPTTKMPFCLCHGRPPLRTYNNNENDNLWANAVGPSPAAVRWYTNTRSFSDIFIFTFRSFASARVVSKRNDADPSRWWCVRRHECA